MVDLQIFLYFSTKIPMRKIYKFQKKSVFHGFFLWKKQNKFLFCTHIQDLKKEERILNVKLKQMLRLQKKCMLTYLIILMYSSELASMLASQLSQMLDPPKSQECLWLCVGPYGFLGAKRHQTGFNCNVETKTPFGLRGSVIWPTGSSSLLFI